MKIFYKIICLLTLIVCVTNLNAQQTIKGKVIDEEGTQLPGVNIQVKGDAKRATQSGGDGTFIINVAPDETLIFKFTGYRSTEMLAKNVSLSNPIKLKEDQTALSEIVVVGYGKVKREDLTGSVATVSVGDMNKAPVIAVEEMLAGRISGVQVSSNSGQPGDETTIVIRGGNSITQDNSPLYVIDGVAIEGFDLGSLNPNDIESISVLKDASSTAIYGARGANGVIVVETKKSTTKAMNVMYSGFLSSSTVANTVDVMDPYEFVRYEIDRSSGNTAKYLTSQNLTLDDYKNVKFLDWQDMLFRNAISQNHNLLMRGNGEKSKYYLSANVADTEGVIINSGRSRNKIRFYLEQNFSKKLTGSVSAFYTMDKNFGQTVASAGSTGTAYATYLMYRVWTYKPTSIGSTSDIINDLYDGDPGDEVVIMHPIITTENEYRVQKKNTLFINGTLNYSFGNGFDLKLSGGYNNRATRNEKFSNSSTYEGRVSQYNNEGVNGSMFNLSFIDWNNENLLSYRKKFTDQKFDVVLGSTIQGAKSDNYGFKSLNVQNEEFGINALRYGIPSGLVSQSRKSTLASFFGRVNYDYKSKYLVTATMRRDASSKFSNDFRWGSFPSAAVAWNLAKENFLENSKIVTEAKFRYSYGVTGNNRISEIDRYQTVDFNDYYSNTGNLPEMVMYPSSAGNHSIRWEQTTQQDLGLDLSLFKSRVNIIVDLYKKVTSDLLLKANIPSNFGFNTAFLNIGKVENKGLELSLSTNNIDGKNFKWYTTFNIAFNKNKILALTDNENSFATAVNYAGGNWSATPLYLAEVGSPVAQFFALKWDGNYQYEDFDQVGGAWVLKSGIPNYVGGGAQPGTIKYVDQNVDGVIDDNDRIKLGSALPKHFGGFNNNFVYKNFSLNVFFQWNYGNKIMNANRVFLEGNPTSRPTMNQFASYANRWTPDNPTDEQYKIGGSGPVGYYSDKTIEDGSYIRLKTVQLAYFLPQKFVKRLGLTRVQLQASAQNLFTWTNYKGSDPEVSVRNSILTPGFDYSSYARSKTLAFGLNVEF